MIKPTVVASLRINPRIAGHSVSTSLSRLMCLLRTFQRLIAGVTGDNAESQKRLLKSTRVKHLCTSGFIYQDLICRY
jgi:hypothetical protein